MMLGLQKSPLSRDFPRFLIFFKIFSQAFRMILFSKNGLYKPFFEIKYFIKQIFFSAKKTRNEKPWILDS